MSTLEGFLSLQLLCRASVVLYARHIKILGYEIQDHLCDRGDLFFRNRV
jgi:hypothetical protein